MYARKTPSAVLSVFQEPVSSVFPTNKKPAEFSAGFLICHISIIRKGGNEDKVYFSDEVHDALRKYYNIRTITATKQPNEQAFFLSSRGTRLSIRSIQNLVHKYTKGIYEVSPHKLRTTFGTNLYVATKDIYLVSAALGHRNVETTSRL